MDARMDAHGCAWNGCHFEMMNFRPRTREASFQAKHRKTKPAQKRAISLPSLIVKLRFLLPTWGGPLLRPQIGECLESWPRLPAKVPCIPQKSGPIFRMFRIFAQLPPRGTRTEKEGRATKLNALTETGAHGRAWNGCQFALVQVRPHT